MLFIFQNNEVLYWPLAELKKKGPWHGQLYNCWHYWWIRSCNPNLAPSTISKAAVNKAPFKKSSAKKGQTKATTTGTAIGKGSTSTGRAAVTQTSATKSKAGLNKAPLKKSSAKKGPTKIVATGTAGDRGSASTGGAATQTSALSRSGNAVVNNALSKKSSAAKKAPTKATSVIIGRGAAGDSLSCNKEVFYNAAPLYNHALKHGNFDFHLHYESPPTHRNTSTRQNRQCNVIWFNLPYSKNIKT